MVCHYSWDNGENPKDCYRTYSFVCLFQSYNLSVSESQQQGEKSVDACCSYCQQSHWTQNMACYIRHVYGLSTNNRSIASDILYKAAMGSPMVPTQRSVISWLRYRRLDHLPVKNASNEKPPKSLYWNKTPIVGAHWAADCAVLSRGCMVTSTLMNENKQVSLMK